MDARLTEARRLAEAGEPEPARALVGAVLKDEPGNLDALHLLGRLMIRMHPPPFASLMLARVVEARPDDPAVHASMAEALLSGGEVDQALASLDRALALDPGHAGALLQRGIALRAAGRPDEALEALDGALAAGADAEETRFWRAATLVGAGRSREVDADEAPAVRFVKAAALAQLRKQTEDAVRLYRAGLEVHPQSAELRHRLAALVGDEHAPERAAPEYVRDLFDRFATTFDTRLTALGYQPERLVALLVGAGAPRLGVVVDAGCGTGLCGPHLRPAADRLEGVDVSSGMLARAAEREVYDELREADLIADLTARAGAYDTVLAADVLTYFGDLREAFDAVGRALVRGGRFAFSVERGGDDDDDGWSLGRMGRYAHTPEYVRERLRAAGLEERRAIEATLRTEGREPVRGLLVVAERTG